MEIKKLQAGIEAILFASGEGVTVARLSEALEADKQTIMRLIQQLSDRLDAEESALCIIKTDDEVQMCARSQYMPVIRRALEIKRNAPLSQAAMEVLAVVAYNQPVTKAFVEQVRGVDCAGVVNSLTAKGLLEEKGRLELPGRPLVYGTTSHFLRCFGLQSLSDLPPLPRQEGDPQPQEDDGFQDGQTDISDIG